jgi:hypothetical protein
MNTRTSQRSPLRSIVRTAALLAAASIAHAAPITVQNHSFESPVTSDYVSINGGLPGWSAPAFVNTYVVKNG